MEEILCILNEVSPYSVRFIYCGENARLKNEDWNGKYKPMVVFEKKYADIIKIIFQEIFDSIMPSLSIRKYLSNFFSTGGRQDGY